MRTTLLLKKLVEAEQELQRGNCYAAYRLVLEAEECALQIERGMIQVQSEKVRKSAQKLDGANDVTAAKVAVSQT